MKSLIRHIILFIFIISAFIVSGQNVSALEKQVESLKNDIKLAEKLLKETSKSKEASVDQINLLKAQISQREALIKTYKRQINLLDNEIAGNKRRIGQLNTELKDHRDEYANLALISYRNRNMLNGILFVFSADNFNTAMSRWRYLREFGEMLQGKMVVIDSLEKSVNTQLAINQSVKKEKDKVLENEKKAREQLLSDKKKLDKDVASLKKKEKQIKNEIAEKEKQQKALKKEIEKIIAAELAKSSGNNESNIKLSADFEQNKGKLPWPVKEGIVSGKYGLSQHPTQSKVKINNNGIDISTSKGMKARVVFGGEVRMVVNTGTCNAVLVRHGSYFTLYSNLDAVSVKKGDKVKVLQEIGTIHTNNNDGKTILHFELWQDKKTVNPEKWIAR